MRYFITQLPEQSRKYWMLIFWEESTDYDELLTVCQTYAYYWISPLHQPDNECGKPHFHVIVGEDTRFCPYKKRSKYSAIFTVKGSTCSEKIGGMPIAYPVDRLKRAIAYMVHLNNPEKQQFVGGLSEIVTNCPDILDGIVKAEPGFSCYEWDEAHKPKSFMGALSVIASEGFLTASETCKLVTWYANHLDVFDDRETAYSAPGHGTRLEFVEVKE